MLEKQGADAVEQVLLSNKASRIEIKTILTVLNKLKKYTGN